MPLTSENLANPYVLRQLDEISVLDSQPMPRLLPGELDLRLHGARNAPMLYEAAERAREYAVSWRRHAVGVAASVAIFQAGAPTQYRLVYGANYKPSEHGDVNVHAEDVIDFSAQMKLRPEQRAIVPAMALIGDVQPDQQSGKTMDTLPPCGICRGHYMCPGHSIGPDTLTMTANPSFTNCEWYVIHALHAYHLGVLTKDEAIGSAAFDSRPLALSKRPAKYYEQKNVSIGDAVSPELRASEIDVQSKLWGPIEEYARNETAFSQRLKELSEAF